MQSKKIAPQRATLQGAQVKIGIIDDDVITANCMRARLNLEFPECTITTYSEPIVTPMLDVYFVDNDFNGQRMATKLLQQIRELNPNALVVAMSSTLEQETLEELMNGGCNAVYDKNRPHQCDAVFEIVGNYLQVLKQVRSRHTRNPFSDAVSSLRELLKEWNHRLNKAGL